MLLISGLFLLTVAGTSSLKKLGPDPTTGVAKLSGLGRVLPSWFREYKSGKNWLGLGRKSLFIYREGSAEAGVSIFMWLWLLLVLGAGRAKGLGGPVAPADSKVVVADGEGGGSTIPDECESPGRVVWDVASVECPGPAEVDSAVLLPASEGSSGICTLRRGRDEPPTRRLLVREGGVKPPSGIEDTETWRFEGARVVSALFACGGDAVLRETPGTSRDCDRAPFASFFTLGSANAARC